VGVEGAVGPVVVLTREVDVEAEAVRDVAVQGERQRPVGAHGEPAYDEQGGARVQAEQGGVVRGRHGGGDALAHDVDVVRQSVSAAVAGDDDSALLGLDPGAPLLVVRRLAVGPDRPLALAVHRYVAHRFSLDVDLAGWPDDRPLDTIDPLERRAP